MIVTMSDDVGLPGPFALHCLADVDHVLCPGEPGWLVAVRMRFDEGFLSVEVNPEDDTVTVSFDPLRPPPLRHWADDVLTYPANDHYPDILGLSSTWRWTLQNQQGYQDAFQIELESPPTTVTLQYLAVASRLDSRRVTGIPITEPASAATATRDLRPDGYPQAPAQTQ